VRPGPRQSTPARNFRTFPTAGLLTGFLCVQAFQVMRAQNNLFRLRWRPIGQW
jgi:hypothetical protein